MEKIYILMFFLMSCSEYPKTFSLSNTDAETNIDTDTELELQKFDTDTELELQELDTDTELELQELDTDTELELQEIDTDTQLELQEIDTDTELELQEIDTDTQLELQEIDTDTELEPQDTDTKSISEIWYCDNLDYNCDYPRHCDIEPAWICPLRPDTITIFQTTYGSQWLFCQLGSDEVWVCPTVDYHRPCREVIAVGFSCQ
jgi:hypothetical protein